MAKNNQSSPIGKINLMVFQLEGDSATLQEGMKSITAVLNKSFPGHQKVTAFPAKPAQVGGLPSPIQDDTEIEDDSVVEAEVSAPTVTKTKKVLKSPQIVEINLEGIDDFLKKYPGDEINKRYLLISHWLKNVAKLEEVSMDHIHTCFRHMGWHVPRDAAQPLRDMKSKSDWFNKGKTKGHYTINHVGEKEVSRILNGAV